MAFQLLPPGTPLTIEKMAYDAWTKDPHLVLQADGQSVRAVPADPRWPFRNLAYVHSSGVPGEPSVHYPVAGDAEGRAGYDPDWALLVMLENDGFKNLRVGQFLAAVSKADPMTSYPDPEGPGFGLPLPFAILAKAHDDAGSNKAVSVLSRFPEGVCKAARWNGLNLAEYQVAAAFGMEVPGARSGGERDARGTLALAAWLAKHFDLPIRDTGVCRALVASGFCYRRDAFWSSGLLRSSLQRLRLADAPSSGGGAGDGEWRARGLLLEMALPGLLALPDEPVTVSVRRHGPGESVPGTLRDNLVRLTATPANAAALFGLVARLPALATLGDGADGRLGWERGDGAEDRAGPDTPLFRCAQWLFAHSSEETVARIAAARLARNEPSAKRAARRRA